MRPKIRGSANDSDDDDNDSDELEEDQNKKSIHREWKLVSRPPSQDPPEKKGVKEKGKGRCTTMKDYYNVLAILRAL